MTGKEMYRLLSGKIGLGNSDIIPQLWEMVCSEEEAALLLAMPGTLESLSQKTGIPADKLEKQLHTLFLKGVMFEREKNGVVTYSPPRNFVQFHDATILWPDAPKEFIGLWKKYMDTEYGSFVNMVNSAGIGPFMRILPVNRAVESRQEVLPYEYVAKMVEEASNLAVTECTCRKTQEACNAPLEVCIQLNRGADYAIKRGTGRKLTKEEALDLLIKSEEAGLVHLSENRSKIGNVICNCCPCCCQALVPLLQSNIKGLTAPSRFTAVVGNAKCIACASCEDICPAKAITLPDETATINAEKCIGCGLCTSVCQENALSMSETRPASFIP